MSTVLPESFLQCMNPSDRKSLGKAGLTASEAQKKWQRGEERKIHDTVIQWLRLRKIPFIHARMDKPSTIGVGWPDVTVIYRGRALCLELKAPGGRLSEEQTDTLQTLEANGTPCKVAYSDAEALSWLRLMIDAIGESAASIDDKSGCV